MFSLIYTWIRGWLNNREAGDLRRHQAHYDVIVMTGILSLVYIILAYNGFESIQFRSSFRFFIRICFCFVSTVLQKYDIQIYRLDTKNDKASIPYDMFAVVNVVNFDALAEASDFRIEWRCLPLLNAGFEPWKSEIPNHKQAECPLDWAAEDQNLNSITCPNDEWAFRPLDSCSGDIHVLFNFDALAQASDFRIERREAIFLCWMQDSNVGNLRHQATR